MKNKAAAEAAALNPGPHDNYERGDGAAAGGGVTPPGLVLDPGGQFAVVVEALPGVPAFVLPGGVVDPAEFVVEPGVVPGVVVPGVVDPVVVPEGQGPDIVFVVDEPGVVVLGFAPGVVVPVEVDGLVVCPGVVVVLWLGVVVVL